MEPALRALRGGFEKLDEDLNFLEQKLDAEFSKTVSVAPTRRRSKSSTVACPAKLLRKLDRLERDIQNLQVDAAQVAVAKKTFAEETRKKVAKNAELLESLSFGNDMEPDDETAGSKERFDGLALSVVKSR